MYSYGPPHMAELKQDYQQEHAYSSYVKIRDVAQKTCQRRWTRGKSGERGSGISVLAARRDDDDDDDFTDKLGFLRNVKFFKYEDFYIQSEKEKKGFFYQKTVYEWRHF